MQPCARGDISIREFKKWSTWNQCLNLLAVNLKADRLDGIAMQMNDVLIGSRRWRRESRWGSSVKDNHRRIAGSDSNGKRRRRRRKEWLFFFVVFSAVVLTPVDDPRERTEDGDGVYRPTPEEEWAWPEARCCYARWIGDWDVWEWR
jgi:hypothetical protein